MTDTLTHTLVRTAQGEVRGADRGDHHVFYGLPYACTPHGADRFAAPRPHTGWAGVRDVTRPGPTAPAPPRGKIGNLDLSPVTGGGWLPGAEYLATNIWTPDTTGNAPVMVFVHGGGFLSGAATAEVFDGASFCANNTVLVTVSYRLGAAGWLHLPDAPDNRGLLDLLAALQWVQDNIATFGGDPTNVTIFGQSAGAMLVAALLATPLSAGLFHRAISQSGSGTTAFTSFQADLVTAKFTNALGVAAAAEALAPVSDAALAGAVGSIVGARLDVGTVKDPLLGITPLGPVIDGRVLTGQPADMVAAHGTRGIDLLIGTNREEANLYLAPTDGLAHGTLPELFQLAARAHPHPATLLGQYQQMMPSSSPGELRSAITSDGAFRRGSERLADAHASDPSSTTYAYEFVWRSNAFDSTLGASHCMELPFVFNRCDVPGLRGLHALLGTDPLPPTLAHDMHRAWTRFAATGNPGWSSYHPDHRTTMRIGATWSEVEDPQRAQRAAWSHPTHEPDPADPAGPAGHAG